MYLIFKWVDTSLITLLMATRVTCPIYHIISTHLIDKSQHHPMFHEGQWCYCIVPIHRPISTHHTDKSQYPPCQESNQVTPSPPCIILLTADTEQNPFPISCHHPTQHLTFLLYINRADSRFAPSQWETLLCNDVSHWLGASLELALH